MATVKYNKEELKTILGDSVIEITFEKVDGTLRDMNATLNAGYLPEKVQSETAEAKAKADTSLAVWDVQAGGWRSFRWDKLKKVNGMDAEIVEQ